MDAFTATDAADEIVAVFLPDPSGREERHDATVVLRTAAGLMEAHTIDARRVFADRRLASGCVRRGPAIVDPVSRQLLGYEMVPGFRQRLADGAAAPGVEPTDEVGPAAPEARSGRSRG